jgi:hypothetical protein
MSDAHSPALEPSESAIIFLRLLNEAAAQKLICDETRNRHADAIQELEEASTVAARLSTDFDAALSGAIEFLSSPASWRSKDQKSEAQVMDDLIALAHQVAQAKSEEFLAKKKEKAARENEIDFQRSEAFVRLDKAKIEMLVSFGAPHPFAYLM